MSISNNSEQVGGTTSTTPGHEQATSSSPLNKRDRPTDITIYGATSFVAKYVIEYLLAAGSALQTPNDTTPPPSQQLHLTLAGRNPTKLQSLLTSLSASSTITLSTLVAESTDAAALRTLASRTAVVLNCAGPFSKYASQLVEACATQGTDYVDITGEIEWVAEMQKKFHGEAQKSGAIMVPLSGFDSVPSDIAVYAAVRALREEVSEEGCDVMSATTWHAAQGLLNGGTLHTALDMPLDLLGCFYDRATRVFRPVPYLVADPFLLVPSTEEVGTVTAWRNDAARQEWINQLPSIDTPFDNDTAVRILSIPFFMAVVNAKVVHASAVRLGYSSSPSHSFTYRERFLPLPLRSVCYQLGLWTALPSLFMYAIIAGLSFFFALPVIGKKVAMILLPPGSGSPDAINRRGYAEVLAQVTSNAGRKAQCELTFEGDPGNLVTAQCVAESALCLLLHRERVGCHSRHDGDHDKEVRRGGFGTPAHVLGDVLIERLTGSSIRKVTLDVTVLGDVRDKKDN